MAFRWCADYGPTLNAGLVVLWFYSDPDQYYATKTKLYFCDFSGGGGGSGPLVPTSGSAHVFQMKSSFYYFSMEKYEPSYEILYCQSLFEMFLYSKTCVKRPLKNRRNKDLTY